MQSKKTFLDRILQNRVAAHLVFWITFPLIFTILASLNSGDIRDHLINYAVMLPSQILASYWFNYYEVPKLLLQKKYLLFTISFALSVYFFSALARFMVVHVAEPYIREDFIQESFQEIFSDPLYLFSVYFPAIYLIVFLMLGAKTIKERFEQRTKMETLEKEKINTELKFLKAQIHPHFLFNTLNNLYALTLTKSDAAPKVVLKLSEMLDFMLYQCDQESINLRKEIDMIQGYIELEQLRYGDQLEVVFNRQFDQPDTFVAPLILLSFVENAFKHGCSANPDDPKIHINLNVSDRVLHFDVFNTKPNVSTPNHDERERKGIGSSNVERQLELNYPDLHELVVEETEKDYKINLKIILN